MLAGLASFVAKQPDFRGKSRLLRLLISAMGPVPSHYGPVMRVRAGDYTSWAALFGYYGEGLRNEILSLPEDGVFIDIGANVGIYTLIAARHLSAGMVVSLEPNPEVYEYLLSNIRLNGAVNVLPINAAVGARTGILRLNFAPDHTGAGYLSDATADAGSSRMVHVLGAEALRPVADRLAVGSSLCKIDVEGHELHVLRTLEQAGLLARLGRLWIEVNEVHLARAGAAPAQIHEVMERNGFTARASAETAASGDVLFVRRQMN